MRRDVAVLLALFAIVALIRIAAPSDFATGDQPLQVANVESVVRGSWIIQFHADGSAASKPPLYNWLAAIPILVTGKAGEFMMKLPSLLSGLLTLLLTWDLARRMAGREAALAAGVLLICSTMFSKQIYFARTDMLLTALTVLQFHAAYLRLPVAFWIATALSLFTKGPLALLTVLALSVLWWWEGTLRERWREMHLAAGLTLSLASFLVWLGLALDVGGQPVYDEMIRAETIDRFAAKSSKAKEYRPVYYYVPYFLARMAPASFFAVIAFVQFRWRRREEHPLAMAVFWFAVMFVLLSLIPSKRAERLFPLFPAACILAGATVARLFERRLRVILAAFAVVMLLGIAIYQHAYRV